MKKKTKTLAKNFSILTVSNFTSKILVFLLVPIYTNILSTEEYGLYDLVITTVSLLLPILTLNIIDAVMRFLMDKNIDKTQVASIGFYYTSVSIIIFAVLIYFVDYFSIGQNISGYKILIVAYYAFYVLNLYCTHIAKGIEKIKEIGVAGVAGTLTMIGMNILFLCYVKLGLKGFFLANIISNVVPVFYLIFSLKLCNYIKFKKINYNLQYEMFFYCLPLIASAIGWWVNCGSDKYIVTLFCGMSACGLLSVAYKIPSIINTFQSIFIQAWQISAVKEYGENDTAIFYGRTFSFLNIMTCLLCSILIILTKPIAYLLFSKEFYLSWQFVPFLLLSCVFNSASGFLGPILSAKKDSKTMALSSLIGVVTNIGLNVAFVYIFGVIGTTIATAMSSFFIFIMRYATVKYDLKIEKIITIPLTWMLLIIQTMIEVYTDMWIIELFIIVWILFVNHYLINEIMRLVKGLLFCTKNG